MNSRPSRSPGLRAASPFLLAASLAAQTVQIPAVPASSLSPAQWHLPGADARVQIVVDGHAVATGPCTVQQLDLLFTATGQPGATFPVEVRLGTAATTPATTSPSFTRNALAGTTPVHGGMLTVPASPGSEPVAATIALATPFAFDPAAGDLVVELLFPMGATRPLQLHRQELATSTNFGPVPDRLTGSFGAQPNSLLTDATIEPGTGRLLLVHHVPSVAGQTVFVAAGLSNTEHLGLALPAPLQPFGMPGQLLLVAPQTLLPSTGVWVVACGFPMQHEGVQFALPLTGQLAGATYYAQAVVVGSGAAASTGADAVVTDGVEVVLGGMTAAPSQAIFGHVGSDLGGFDPNVPYSQRAGAFVAPVLRLTLQQ